MEMEMMGRSLGMEQEQILTHRYDVRNRASDGTVTLDYTTIRTQGEMAMPSLGQTMRYDSADTTATGRAGQMSRRMRAITGHTLTARLSPRGSVQAVTGVEALLDSLTAGQDTMQAKLLRRMLSPEAVRQQVNLNFNIYPERAVTPGDRWSSQSSIRLGVPMQIDATYTLDSIRSDRAFVDAHMRIASAEGDSTMRIGGMAMDMSLEGHMDGTILVDVPSGLPQETDLTLEMSGRGTVNRGEGASLEIDLSSKGTVRTTFRPWTSDE